MVWDKSQQHHNGAFTNGLNATFYKVNQIKIRHVYVVLEIAFQQLVNRFCEMSQKGGIISTSGNLDRTSIFYDTSGQKKDLIT